MTENQTKVCGLCGKPLFEQYLDDGTHRFVHAYTNEGFDHEPMPVSPDESVLLAPRCDFCFDEVPMDDAYTLETKPFAMVIGTEIHRMSALWCLCKPCRFAQSRGWVNLIRRMTKKAVQKDPSGPVHEREIKALFTKQINGICQGFVEVRPTRGDELTNDETVGLG